MARKKVLVVEDERKVCELVKTYLERDGYEVVIATNGKVALEMAQQHKPDIVLLDLNLPELDGLEVFKALHSRSNVPIIMLTARDEEIDRIVGLEMGADDYVTKPFSPREVAARVSAVLRRYKEGPAQVEQIAVGDLRLDFGRHEATYTGKPLPLTAAEFKLLSVLARNPGRVYTRLQLMDLAFGETYEGYERTIDAHIKNIRQKMAKLAPKNRDPLVTVRGVGYRLERE